MQQRMLVTDFRTIELSFPMKTVISIKQIKMTMCYKNVFFSVQIGTHYIVNK